MSQNLHADLFAPPPLTVGLILARAQNGVIGRQGQLPWHIPEDLAHFRRVTRGAAVIMGRRTWQSLPARFRPLPERLNIVLSRQPDWVAEGATRAGDLVEAIDNAQRSGLHSAWVIGGAEIYAQALGFAQVVELTEVLRDFEGDAFAPEFPAQHWQTVREETLASASGIPLRFVRLERRP